jgi:ketosteroid isomerase-like protein
MTVAFLTEPTEGVALTFLQAYWRGDLAAALGCCTSTASMELPPSIPIETPARIADLLPVIFRGVYSLFGDGRFDVLVENVISERSTTLVEYIATGRLVNGRDFRCRYAMVLTIQHGKVAFARSYTDTQYVAAELLSEPPDAAPSSAAAVS